MTIMEKVGEVFVITRPQTSELLVFRAYKSRQAAADNAETIGFTPQQYTIQSMDVEDSL